MKVTVEELSPILKKVSVDVPSETVDRALDRAYASLRKSARIKGFRPGKTPRHVLERYYGHQVLHEVTEDVIRDSWPLVVEEQDLKAVNQPEVEHGEHVHPGKPYSYVAKVEVLPQVQVTDYVGLAGTRPKVEVTDEEVQTELERLQNAMAQVVPVEDRTKIEQGDYVVADVEATVDGETFDEGSGPGLTFEASEGDITQGNVPEAIGREIGETLEITHAFREGSPDAFRGKDAHFKMTLTAIKLRKVPAIDDELAKDLGEEGVESLEALRAFIRERITEHKTAEADSHLRDSVVDSLIAKNPIEVPQSMVGRTAMSMIRPFIQQMIQSGADARQLIDSDTPAALAAQMQPRAETVVKGALLLEAVADKENLAVTDEDREAEYAKLAKERRSTPEKVKASFQKDADELEGLDRRIREDKALAFIQERATVTEAAPEDLAHADEDEPKAESAGAETAES